MKDPDGPRPMPTITFVDPANTTVLGSVGLDRTTAVEFSPGNQVDGPWSVVTPGWDGQCAKAAATLCAAVFIPCARQCVAPAPAP